MDDRCEVQKKKGVFKRIEVSRCGGKKCIARIKDLSRRGEQGQLGRGEEREDMREERRTEKKTE